MSTGIAHADDGAAGEEALLASELTRLIGGEVISLQRQARWRKAWFATVRKDGEDHALYIRGDKQIDAEPFPGLEREATLIRMMEERGLPVPRYYGMTQFPQGIVMASVPGTRDVSTASSAAAQREIAESFIRILAKTHQLDIEPFVAAGIHRPEGPQATALAFLTPHIALYRRTKKKPEPMIEWALRWVQRNAQSSKAQPRLLQGDPAQFLIDQDKITCIHDFEAMHIGDPMHDLAMLRLRHGYEPLGAEPDDLIGYYAQLTGTEIDGRSLSFHTAASMLACVMSLAGPLSEPNPADMQMEYQVWDVFNRRAMLFGIAELMGVDIRPSPPVVLPDSRSAVVGAVLDATVARISLNGSPVAEKDRDSARQLTEWSRAEAYAADAHEAADLNRAAKILGTRPSDWRACDAAMEAFVATAGEADDAALFDYFTRQLEDRVAAALPVRPLLEKYALKPFRDRSGGAATGARA
jgi:aminoglycoside phosphotransferase (APT) family kinase protein